MCVVPSSGMSFLCGSEIIINKLYLWILMFIYNFYRSFIFIYLKNLKTNLLFNRIINYAEDIKNELSNFLTISAA